MAKSSFSGPVFSGAGFISGTDSVAASVTSATLAITSANIDSYNGKVIPLNKADGITVTLPAATGSQAVLRFLIGTTITSNNAIIKVANATDAMAGYAAVGGATAGIFGTAAASDTITMNGSTTGGVAGSYVELLDVAAGDWIVSASLVGSGTPATPFSATVS